MTDMARLHTGILANCGLQQFIYRWDEMLSIMKKRPTDEDLMNLFVLQLDVNLPKTMNLVWSTCYGTTGFRSILSEPTRESGRLSTTG
jgi:hypothetical protein